MLTIFSFFGVYSVKKLLVIGPSLCISSLA